MNRRTSLLGRGNVAVISVDVLEETVLLSGGEGLDGLDKSWNWGRLVAAEAHVSFRHGGSTAAGWLIGVQTCSFPTS